MKRNRMIDFLKGCCIIFIIIDHCTLWGNELRLKLLFPFWITMAVPILMVLSGYAYAMSYERHQIRSLKDAYQFQFVLGKFIRYTIPFLIAYLLEFAISAYDNGIQSIMGVWLKDFFVGGWGPGSYYYPIMLQFIFVYPIIYFIIKKYNFAGVILCGLLNAVYELLQYFCGMSYSSYRLLLFRYILLIAFGCYLFIGKCVIKRWLSLPCILIGTLFTWAYNYQGYEPKILIHWTETCFIAVLFILPLMKILLTSAKLEHIAFPPIELFGKASYHVFLVQMVYFNYVSKVLYPHINSILLANLINLIVCIGGGIIFYFVETKTTKKITHFLSIVRKRDDKAYAK